MKANPFSKILVPVDFSEHSARALAHAVELATPSGASVVALHVAAPVAESIPLDEALFGDAIDEHRVRQHVLQLARTRLAEFVAKQPAAIRTNLVAEVKEGLPDDVILDTAEETGVDLIVIGSHGRRGITRWLMGSVAERVVRLAECPVLVVH